MASVRVSISIPAERYQALYSGRVHYIQAIAEGGLRVQFPGSALQKYVTHDGVSGTFDLQFTESNKLTGVRRVGD